VIGMNEGIKTVIYPVKDIEKAKALFRALMGEPAYDSPAYVGYTIGDQNIGLDPTGRRHGLVGPVPYWHVDDIKSSLQALLDAGAELVQPVQEIGGGGVRAVVKDGDGNAIGLLGTAG
jgi:predicted enzyme related to lactoylglutathione lyase